VLVAVLCAGASAARAQPEDTQARSRALYDEGSRAYKAGDYPRAIEKFLAAYDLSGAPAILFNIAQAYRLAGNCQRALEYYRRSLDEEPEAANRAEVEERIAEMQACVEQAAQQKEEATPEPEPEPEPEPAASAPPPPVAVDLVAPRRKRSSVLPLVTAGVGAAAAVAGGIIYLQARAKFDQVEESCPCEPGSFSGWETATDASYVLMGAGVVVAGAGLIWWWRQSHSQRPQRIGVVPTARGVGWSASF
jgi:tetratricopeptide (TPR) repeat protein